MLSKLCGKQGCNAIINQGQKYCDKHQSLAGERHRLYDEHRRDKKAKAFYTSMVWIRTKEYALRQYSYIDLYDYFQNGRITRATTIHHIEELRDNWDKRLDLNNLFPVSSRNHNVIHALYEKDKTAAQELLRELMARWKSEVMG